MIEMVMGSVALLTLVVGVTGIIRQLMKISRELGTLTTTVSVALDELKDHERRLRHLEGVE